MFFFGVFFSCIPSHNQKNDGAFCLVWHFFGTHLLAVFLAKNPQVTTSESEFSARISMLHEVVFVVSRPLILIFGGVYVQSLEVKPQFFTGWFRSFTIILVGIYHHPKGFPPFF